MTAPRIVNTIFRHRQGKTTLVRTVFYAKNRRTRLAMFSPQGQRAAVQTDHWHNVLTLGLEQLWIADTPRPALHCGHQVLYGSFDGRFEATSSSLLPRGIFATRVVGSSRASSSRSSNSTSFTRSRCRSNSCTTVLCHRSIHGTQQTTTCHWTHTFGLRRLLATIQSQVHHTDFVPPLHLDLLLRCHKLQCNWWLGHHYSRTQPAYPGQPHSSAHGAREQHENEYSTDLRNHWPCQK